MYLSHPSEIRLCELADEVVAVGPKLADAYSRYLRYCKKDQSVFKITPSIFSEFSHVEQAPEERRTFCVLVFGRGDNEDFELKGYDIAVKAIVELKDSSYQLVFVGAPHGKEGGVADKLCQHGIARKQLTVAALEALSAGLPVLVSGNSGLGEALQNVLYGSNCVVDSEDPKEWSKAIRAVRQKDRDLRLEETKFLCGKYAEKYSWQKQCDTLVEKMLDITQGK